MLIIVMKSSVLSDSVLLVSDDLLGDSKFLQA